MPISFAIAMKGFFGSKGTFAEFNAELKALSFTDKLFFASELRKSGIDCDDPK